MNSITVYGRLGRDCEVKEVKGKKVIELHVCQCQRKSEEREGKSPMWWQVSYWGDKYEKLANHLKKGSSVIVTGEMAFPKCYQTKTAGWNVNLSMEGNSLMFNPFGSNKQVKEHEDNESDEKGKEEKVVYPHEFQPAKPKENESEDLGDLF